MCLALVMALPYILFESDPILYPDSIDPIVDIHMHVAGLGGNDSGCFVSQSLQDNFRFNIYLKAMGVTKEQIENEGDQVIFDHISKNIQQSDQVSAGVVLAMDGVVDASGVFQKELTEVYVPNDYVAENAARFDNILFGASVHPSRTDALQRLDKAHQQGAVLVKWLPSIMDIDPSNTAYIPYYEKLIELKLPLLTHTGQEKSFSHAKDELADPLRLELPLSLGVTVIAAHIATTGESEGEDNFQRILPLIKKYSNLYVDISSLTQINKLGYLSKALAIDGLTDRMLYGTDWPLQFFPLISSWYHLPSISMARAAEIGRIENQWDRDVALKYSKGVPSEVFASTAKLLGLKF